MKINNVVSHKIWEDRYKKPCDDCENDNLRRVAKYLGNNDKEVLDFYNVMNERLFFPAGRTMSNAGIGEELTLNNCFNLNNVPDSIEGIFEYIKYGALTQKAGGGTGYNFSLIRPKGTPTSNDAIASGVVSFMDTFNSQTHTILQGSRRGANMGVLMIYHPDIYEYLNSKSYDEGKLIHFNLSIMVDKDFMNAKDKDEDIWLHYPCMTPEGTLIKDESKWKIKKKVKARELWDLIMRKAYDTGEYGVFFYENLNKDNNLWYIENITGTNPCFTADMKLLTDKGYLPIGELENKKVNVINKNGNITKGKVWCSGEKETIKLKFSNGKIIKCTPNHVFMLNDGSECEAKDLKDKRVMSYIDNEENPKVISAKPNGIEKVYDFTEPELHWGVIEGLIAHNCGEYVSGVLYGTNPKTKEPIHSLDYMGACDLGSLFLHNFILYPFTKYAKIDYTKLDNAVNVAVRMLDNIIDINKFPLKQYENYQKNVRTIGMGITGISDSMVMLNMKYGSKESVEFAHLITNYIAKKAYRASIELAKEKGEFNFLDRKKYVESLFIDKHILFDGEWSDIAEDILKYGIRNARLLSIAPTGTLSLSFGENCSSGLEPIFSLICKRKVKMGGQDDKDIQIVEFKDYAYNEWLKIKDHKDCIVKEDIFVTAMDLPVQAHIDVLSAIAFNVDMSCSKTINIPTEYSFEDTKMVYDMCYKRGIKGCTIFRPNPIRQGILLTGNETKKEESNLKRGQWKPKADDTIYIERKVYIGCGQIKLFIGWSDKEKQIQDFYVVRSGQGGCERNLQALVIAMSGMLRLGGKLCNIERAFKGVGGCNSFATKRAVHGKLSSGSSCGTAILLEINKFLKEKDVKSEPKQEVKPSIEEKTAEEKEKFTDIEKEYLKNNGEIAFVNLYHKCPQCGEPVHTEGTCLTCTCGFTKC